MPPKAPPKDQKPAPEAAGDGGRMPPPGPRPLAMHCLIATSFYTSLIAACAASKNGSISWAPTLRERAKALESDLANHKLDDIRTAVDAQGRQLLGAMLDGISAWRGFSRPAKPVEPPSIWREGTTRLLDYAPQGGRPVLVIPSLINRAYILDLTQEGSLLRFLAAQGLRPLLVDWGAPGPVERGFDIAAYMLRLRKALLRANAIADNAPVPVLGYCMGGTLAVGLAALAGARVASLALMAAPWDFHAERPDQARAVAAFASLHAPLWTAMGEVPVDMLQGCFAALDPFLAVKKFARFATMDPASASAQAFVALEDWLNDGVPMAAPAALEAMTGWYGANRPARLEWQLAGKTVDPAAIDRPALALIPAADRIVPPESALALARALPQAQVIRPGSGHIGMVVGRGMRETVWKPLADFLRLN